MEHGEGSGRGVETSVEFGGRVNWLEIQSRKVCKLEVVTKFKNVKIAILSLRDLTQAKGRPALSMLSIERYIFRNRDPRLVHHVFIKAWWLKHLRHNRLDHFVVLNLRKPFIVFIAIVIESLLCNYGVFVEHSFDW